jgi:hypothetical protein
MTEVYSHLSPNVNHEAVGSLLADHDAAEKERQVGHGLGTVLTLKPRPCYKSAETLGGQ